jgi:hypothetical protein
MDATSFEFNLSLPADSRFAATLRNVAVHAARYAGCGGEDADAFGLAVEAVMLGCVNGFSRDSTVSIVVRRITGPVEVLIACDHRFDAMSAKEACIRIDWTREAGRDLCRISRIMPVAT